MPITYNAFCALVGQLTDPATHKTFYEPRQINYPQVEHPSKLNIEIRAAELSVVDGRTHYNYTRQVAFSCFCGDPTRRLGVIYSLLISAPDNKDFSYDCIGCPNWFREIMKQMQNTQHPTLFGYNLIGVAEDRIFLARQNPDEAN